MAPRPPPCGVDTLDAVAPFDLPMTVRTDAGRVSVVLRLTRPARWSRVRAAVCAASGLAPHTRLYHGPGPVPDNWTVGMPPLVRGCELGTEPGDAAAERPPVVLAVIAGPDAGAWIALGTESIRIGRDPASDLPLRDPAVSYRHAVLEPTATGLLVRDLDSTNGVFVDGVPADGASGGLAARTGSVLRMGNSVLQVRLTAQPPGGFRPDGSGRLRRAGHGGRAMPPLPPIPAPPVAPPASTRRALPVVSVAVGAVVGGALALVMRNPMFLAFAAFGPLTMVGTAVADRARGRRSRRRRRIEYHAAVAAWRAASDAAIRATRRSAWATWPGPAELLWRAQAASARLWERTRADPAYLVLAAGCGGRLVPPDPADSVGRGAPATGGDGSIAAGGGAAASVDDGANEPARVAITDAPVTVPLRGVIALTGADGRGMARWLIAQLACLHSPSDVALLVLGARQDLVPCVDLPHALDAPGPSPTPSDVIEAARDRDVVVVLDGATAASSELGRSLIALARADAAVGRADRSGRGEPGPGRHVTVVCLTDSTQQLPVAPMGAPTISVAGARSAESGRSDGAVPTTIDANLLREICRALAPLAEAASACALPTSVDLTAIVGPIDAATLRERWKVPRLQAIVGMAASGPVSVDLVADGPHLLVAGTTGSGKSELLQTLVGSLAVAAPPEALTFLLVDYKGGSAFDGIRDLPHVVGVLTDLDPAESERALTSLRAELHRRERLAAARSVGGIDEGAGGSAAAVPHLVVLIDEFATLAVELPAFLAGVLDIAQRGRSLGLHLVLATQRPAGVVTPAMRANISTRICLRVTDSVDSLDVIGSPDAARLPAGVPGRAIVAGRGAPRTFQTALVSCPAPPDLVVAARFADTDAGRGKHPAAAEPRRRETILHALVAAARSASTDRPVPRRPWTPPLPADFVPTDDHPHCLALADLPEEQERRPLDVPDASVLVVGPAGSGRSTALRRIALVAAGRGAELIVVDGAGDLADLADWTAVSTHLDLTEPRLVLRVLHLLGDPTRRPRDGHLRYVIIDHFEVVAAELERADYLLGPALLTELPTRAGGTVRMVASGPEALAHQRAAAGFPVCIRLGGHGGRSSPGWSGGADPGAVVPGRGTWGGAAVQLARCPRGSAPTNETPRPSAHGRSARRNPNGYVMPVIVRPLPPRVYARDLPTGDAAHIPLGIGGDEARTQTMDLTEAGAIVVAGPPRAGVSTTLALIADRAAATGIPVVALAATPHDGGAAAARVIDVRHGTESLRAMLAEHVGPLLLVADHGGTGDDFPAAALLAQFLRVCAAGQQLLLGVRTDVLHRARRGHLHDALSCRRGIILAPDQPDGALFDVALPKRRRIVPGRGVWIERGSAVPVQVAQL